MNKTSQHINSDNSGNIKKPPGSRAKDNKGSALVLVVLTASLFVILAAGMYTVTYSSYRYNVNDGNRNKAFYIAEACFEETRARVTARLQSFINKGDYSQNSYTSFLNALPEIAGEVTGNNVIKSLGADSIAGNFVPGPNSCTVLWRVTVGGIAQELKASYLFDAPGTFTKSSIATDKMKILWGQ
ncbi:MAG: hypothetical protein GX184_00850 [Clostridiaceae bacterium]|nr:hypothetical protein [Clostridiaceae bacterium]